MLSTRGKNVLNFIVSDYINESNPVASSSIVSRHKLGVSSATIRNEVADLENYGYITRPYSSAGSIPLQKGYRAYVETIKKSRLPVKLRTNVYKQLLRAERYVEDWTEVAATLLAGLVGNMAIVSFPKSREARVKHLELVPVQKLSALLIIVFDQYKLTIDINDRYLDSGLIDSFEIINIVVFIESSYNIKFSSDDFMANI